ncbi:uncharacterized protein MELLADRAFT_112309 [Melampsora larici-populina 98AG31]|uniref:Uncharacterized protein n=1 Tax=Melampsora larici-populina (strain 98AG31 / pathotype 3-4-7) TaxID=747676 RepID=F4S629_MELLP|nr:uncharacterized protein MELLADRAFT_112309 [Melampsora larici-populina 98AG31]EGF99863.1 hypothetical protein MELLADRAFT_112309 [Melampsora larici-populina 98AG31]
MEEDVCDGYNWRMNELAKCPQKQFEQLPIPGNKSSHNAIQIFLFKVRNTLNSSESQPAGTLDQASSDWTVDLANMKSIPTTALLFSWPIFLTAMGVRELSNTIGHPVATTESHLEPWSYLLKSWDQALQPQEGARTETRYPSGITFNPPGTVITSNNIQSTGHITPIETFYTDAYGKSSLWQVNKYLFNTRDRLVPDHWSGVASLEQRPINQEAGKEHPQSNTSPSSPRTQSPWRESSTLNSPLSATHVDNLGGGTSGHLEDQLQDSVYYSELNHVVSQLPRIEADPMWWLDQLSAADFDGVQHNDGLHLGNPSDSVTGLGDHSEVHNTYPHDPLAFLDASHVGLPLSSSGHQNTAEHQVKSSENVFAHILGQNVIFDTPFGSQIVNNKPKPISHDGSLQPSTSVISPVANQRQPLEILEDSNHDTPQSTQSILPASEAEQKLERSSYSLVNSGLQDSWSKFSRLQHSSPASLAHEEPTKHGPVSLLESGILKRPVHPPGLEPQSSRTRPHHNHNDGFVSQVETYPPSINTDIHTPDSSTPSNQQSSRLQFRTPTTPVLDSETHHIPRLKKHRKDQDIRNDPVDIENHESTSAIERYYGKFWPQEKPYKETFFFDDFVKLGTFVPTSNHPSTSPRVLIDTFQPEIEKFMNTISKNCINWRYKSYLTDNMRHLLDNYLEILSICSEVVSSNGSPHNMAGDLREGYDWLMEGLEDLPHTQFTNLPIPGNKYSSRRPRSRAFTNLFDRFTVFDGTVYWLKHLSYSSRRERVAATFVLAFMRQKRAHWIHHLTPYSADELFVRTLLIFAKRVRPLKYPTKLKEDNNPAHQAERRIDRLSQDHSPTFDVIVEDQLIILVTTRTNKPEL